MKERWIGVVVVSLLAAPAMAGVTAEEVIPCDGTTSGTCHRLTIECGIDLPPIKAQVKINDECDASSTCKGTVVFTTGGRGSVFYEERGEQLPSGCAPVVSPRNPTEVVCATQEAGFRTAQVRWYEEDNDYDPLSWWDGPNEGVAPGSVIPAGFDYAEGFWNLACRPVSVLEWIELHYVDDLSDPEELLCGTGNSGGADQLAYGLTHYGMKDDIDLLVLTAGPPMTRFDRACTPGDDLELEDGSRKTVDWGFGLNDVRDGCQNNDQEHPLPEDYKDALRAAGHDCGSAACEAYFPQTLIRLLWGLDDYSGINKQGEAFEQLLLSAGTQGVRSELVDAGHPVPQDAPHEVFEALQACRHCPQEIGSPPLGGGSVCLTTDLGYDECFDDGTLVRCPEGETVVLRECSCPTGSCNDYQFWSCEPNGGQGFGGPGF